MLRCVSCGFVYEYGAHMKACTMSVYLPTVSWMSVMNGCLVCRDAVSTPH